MKRYRNKVLVGILFLVFGIMFVAFSAVDAIRNYETYLNRVRVEGVVEDVNYKTKSTLIKYNTEDNTTIQKEFNLIDTSMNKGDTIIVYYHKDKVTQAFIKTQIIYVAAFFGIDILFIIIFIIFLTIVLVSIRGDIKLVKTGKRVEAKIESITINRTMTRCTYKVVLSYQDGKKVYKFKYNSVWFNIKDVVDSYKIKTIPVYVTKNYKKYYIDFSTLETLNN
jgi:hypothetical protein